MVEARTMSAFADLFGDVVTMCAERYRRPMPVHWDYYPDSPPESRWRCWVDADGLHAVGSTGEESLRRLHAGLASRRYGP
jgi:hypothetical protein